MHWVEVKRGLDLQKPGSQDQDPIFGYKLPQHEVGYPGRLKLLSPPVLAVNYIYRLCIRAPTTYRRRRLCSLCAWQPRGAEGQGAEEWEAGHAGRLTSCFQWCSSCNTFGQLASNARHHVQAFAGFVMSAQVTGLGPIAALQQHLSDPINTTIFSKAAIVPGAISQPPCAIEPVHNFQVCSLAHALKIALITLYDSEKVQTCVVAGPEHPHTLLLAGTLALRSTCLAVRQSCRCFVVCHTLEEICERLYNHEERKK